jgi:hypothetical protein
MESLTEEDPIGKDPIGKDPIGKDPIDIGDPTGIDH